jgi:hypothetical protein
VILAYQHVLHRLTGICGTLVTISVACVPDQPNLVHWRKCSLRAEAKKRCDLLPKGAANMCSRFVIIIGTRSTVGWKMDKVVNLQVHQVLWNGNGYQQAPQCGAPGVGESRVTCSAKRSKSLRISSHTAISIDGIDRIRWIGQIRICPETA